MPERRSGLACQSHPCLIVVVVEIRGRFGMMPGPPAPLLGPGEMRVGIGGFGPGLSHPDPVVAAGLPRAADGRRRNPEAADSKNDRRRAESCPHLRTLIGGVRNRICAELAGFIGPVFQN